MFLYCCTPVIIIILVILILIITITIIKEVAQNQPTWL